MQEKDRFEIDKIAAELKKMQQRQIANLDRQRIEHAALIGALKLEHEKQIYLRNAETVKTLQLDKLFDSDGVGSVTGFDLDTTETDHETWDAWKYKEQMFGPLLTGSTKADADYMKWRQEKEYCQEDAASIVKKEQECLIMTFDEYFDSRQ